MKFFINLRGILLLICIFSTTLIFANDTRPKVGLVLSGGGARGFAHVGVLKVLDSLQIPIDYIASASFGAITGSLYAIGKTGYELEKMGTQTNWESVLSDLPPRNKLPYFRKKESGKYQLKFGLDGTKPVAPTGFIQGQSTLMELSQWYHEFEQINDFTKFPIPFKCVAMDLITGNQVVLDSGSLTRAVRSSLSIPTIFAPVEWGDSLLIDGGVINNLPVDVVKEMGADIVISVNVASQNKKPHQIKNIINVLEQSISVHEYELEYENEDLSDLVIRPNLKGFYSTDFLNSKFLPMVARGYEAGVQYAEELKAIKEKVGTIVKHKSLPVSVKNPILSSIDIHGNKQLSFNFLYRLIGYEPGDVFNSKELEARINEIYSLGYFNTIFYEISLNDDDTINLNILIAEKSMREFNTGLRWDNRYGFIGAINLRINSTWFPGLVFEEHAQFAGIRKNIAQLYYPSRTMDFPLYPFIRNYYHHYDLFYPLIFEDNEFPYATESNGFGIGLGFLLKNFWTMEWEFRHDDFRLERKFGDDSQQLSHGWEKNRYAKISIHLDTIDDILLPMEGSNITLLYENNNWGEGMKNQIDEYNWYSLQFDKYLTWNRHTLSFSSFYQNATEHTPIHRKTIYGGPNLLIGYNENQLNGLNTSIVSLKYRYRHKKDIFCKLMMSNIISNQFNESDIVKNLWSYGVGVTLTSPVGPLEFVWSLRPKTYNSPHDFESKFIFNAGYKF
jgi:NTE family protein